MHRVGPGTLLGRYRLVEKVGSGGMGDVFRAVDAALGREVAVKVLPAEAVAGPERRRRFETEARSAAGVSHPNLVPVHDVGECDGVPFIVQELVDGHTVEELLSLQGALPLSKVTEWGAQAAEGLAHAHDAGILHRDVKPSNLIVGRDGRLRVLDFGLAKMLGSAGRPAAGTGLTAEGTVVGTAPYMSPEQALGLELDSRSDAFSLGIVLYEMAVGRRPFDGASPVDVMHAIAYAPPRPLSAGDPPLPPDLQAVLEKALEKRPEDRYQTLRDLAVDLRRVARHSGAPRTLVAGPPAASAATLATERAPGDPGLRRVRAVKAALAAAVPLVVAAAAVLLLRGRLPAVAPPSATRILTQTDAREESPSFSPDGGSFVYSANSRGSYDLYLRLLSGSTPVRLTDSPEDDRDPVFTPGGASILFSRESRETGAPGVWEVPTLGGAPRRVLPDGDQPAPVPDGRRLVFRRRDGERTSLWVAWRDGRAPRLLVESGPGEVTGARVSPDGKWAYFLRRETFPGALGDLFRVLLDGGPPERLTRDRRDVWGRVAFAASGRAVLFSSVRSGAAGIWMVAPGGGEPRPVLTGSGWTISPDVSPDGRSLLAQSRRFLSDAWEYALADGSARPLTEAGTVWAPTRLRDGRLLYADWARQEEELDLEVEDAEGVRTYLAEGSNPRVSPDGRTVYFSTAAGQGKRRIASVDVDGGPVRALTSGEAVDDYPDPLADGSGVVFCRTGGGAPGLYALTSDGRERLLFAGDAMSSRAARDAVVFRSCPPGGSCGVHAVGRSGGPPRLLVPDGRWPAALPEGDRVVAWAGPKGRPVLYEAPVDGSAPARRLFDLRPPGDEQFWAVFTLDVSPGGASVVATRQRVNDDVVLFEGVFR